MAGEAQSTKFMLSTATVMLGPQEDLMNLDVEVNSIGLVKNFEMKSDPAYTDLTQGVKNTTVYSVMTGNPVTATSEVYEYTAKNIAYGLGLEGSSLVTKTQSTTVTTALPAPVAPALTDEDLIVADVVGLSAGDMVFVYYGTENDQIYSRKIVSIATGTKTLTLDSGFPRAIPAGSKVMAVNVIGVGSKAEQPFFAAKIVGTLAGGEPIIILLPKIRIVKGFTLGFKSDDYGNMPFEMTVFDLVPTDPNYAFFKSLNQSNSAILVQ